MDQNIDMSIDGDYENDSGFPSKRPKTVPVSPEIQALASQLAPKELVKYDYIFKKLLTENDVKDQMEVPHRDAEKHLPHMALPDVSKTILVSIYDTNREQTRDWDFSRNALKYSFTGHWKVYVEDNQVQEGDSVLFYIMRRDQIVNSEFPHYAVKIEKAGETTVTSPRAPLAIPFDKKALEGPISMMDTVD